MRTDIILRIKSDPKLKQFLREHSYYYKDLNRNPESIKYIEEHMKKKYHLTTEDKLIKLQERLQTIGTILDIMKEE